MNTSVKPQIRFIQDLVLIAIDECHLVWDWEEFRNDFARLGEVRQMSGNKLPCLLSPQLSHPGCALTFTKYARSQTVLSFSLPVRRDNINLLIRWFWSVVRCNPQTAEKPEAKTLVFVGRQTAIAMAACLQKKLPPSFRRPNTTIMTSYSNINSAKKERTPKIMAKKNRTCIVICTDAFEVGIDISDILRVIQWGASPSLNHNSLTQRIGRAARDPNLVGSAVIYVDKSLLPLYHMNTRPQPSKSIKIYTPTPTTLTIMTQVLLPRPSNVISRHF